MTEPKFHVGQPVLVKAPHMLLPKISSIVVVRGFFECGDAFVCADGKSRYVRFLGWHYDVENVFEGSRLLTAPEVFLFPIRDPDTEYKEEQENEQCPTI